MNTVPKVKFAAGGAGVGVMFAALTLLILKRFGLTFDTDESSVIQSCIDWGVTVGFPALFAWIGGYMTPHEGFGASKSGTLRSIAFALFAMSIASALSACESFPWVASADDPNAPPKTQADKMFDYACSALSTAHGSFVALSPALIASGRMDTAAVATELATFEGLATFCDPEKRPKDVAELTTRLMAQAAAIYLLMAPTPVAALHGPSTRPPAATGATL